MDTRWRPLLLILAIFPIINIGGLIINYGVDAPFADDWHLITLIAKYETGSLSVFDLVAQHNEHRTVLLRVVTLLNVSVSNWNLIYEMYLSFAVVVTAFVVLGWGSPSLCVLAVSILLFSPAQYEIFLSAFNGLAWFLHHAWMVGFVLLLSRPERSWLQFFGAVVFALLATYSLACGLALWIIGFVYLVVERTALRQTYVWLIISVLVIGTYSLGYVHPVRHPDVSFHPLESVRFVLAFLGNSMSTESFQATCFGIVGLGVLVGFTRFHYRRHSLGIVAPWLLLASVVILDALVISLGRGGFISATSSRYVSLGAYFWVSLVMIAATTPVKRNWIVPLTVIIAVALTYPMTQWRWADYHQSVERIKKAVLSGTDSRTEAVNMLKRYRLSLFRNQQ